MNGPPQIRRPFPWLPALTGLLIPGLGHIWLGHFRTGSVVFAASLTYIVLLTHLALLGPWVMGAAFVLTPAVHVFSAISAVQFAEQKRERKLIALLEAIVAMIVAYQLIQPLKRTMVFIDPTRTMSPTLLPGDAFALDRRERNYAVGDIVAFEIENPKRMILRRIKALDDSKVILATDNKEYIDNREVGIEQLRGKVLYICYSFEPMNLKPRLERFLMRIK